jgi:hypothetical protein
MDLLRTALRLSLVPSALFFGATLLFAVPLGDVGNALDVATMYAVAWNAIIWVGAGLFTAGTTPVVYRRTDLSRRELLEILKPMLKYDNVPYESLDRLVAVDVAVRMNEAPYTHLALNGGIENLYVGTVKGRTEVALGPYRGEHSRVIDLLMREIDVTLDNL